MDTNFPAATGNLLRFPPIIMADSYIMWRKVL